jgi:DNA-binding IclR family transcriptional regulator
MIVDNPKLTSERAEQIIYLLRDNPGVEMTLGDIADETGLPTAELAAHLEELNDHGLVLKATTTDGFDTYSFPADFQRGATPNAR